jgi:hypothetical protein
MSEKRRKRLETLRNLWYNDGWTLKPECPATLAWIQPTRAFSPRGDGTWTN